jgi:hypothetical protein
MQMNRQVRFLLNGGDSVRELPLYLHPCRDDSSLMVATCSIVVDGLREGRDYRHPMDRTLRPAHPTYAEFGHP